MFLISMKFGKQAYNGRFQFAIASFVESVQLDTFRFTIVSQKLLKLHEATTSPDNTTSLFELDLFFLSSDQVSRCGQLDYW